MRNELLMFFVWRDFLIRYKQAVLGVFWALIRPFLNMLIFIVVFQKIAHVETESAYPLFVLAGLLPWQFFASCIQSSSMCLIQNMVLIQKASFPKIFLPLSSCIVNLFDMVISLALFFIILLIYQPSSWSHLMMFPVVCSCLILFCFAISLWFSAMTARFKDLVIAIPYLIQVGIFICPIGFSTQLVPKELKPLLYFNPLVGIIDGFRWSLLGEGEMFLSFSYSLFLTLILAVSGYFFFKRIERHIVDII